MRGAIELIHDLEDCVLPRIWRSFRCEQPSYAEMRLGAQLFRDQRISGLPDTVVEEPVGTFRADDKSRADGFPKVFVHLLNRGLGDYAQQSELGAVAKAGKLL